jgi:hypothetical protein
MSSENRLSISSSSQAGLNQNSFFQVGIEQVGILQTSLGQIGSPQIGLTQVNIRPISLIQTGTVQVSVAQIDINQSTLNHRNSGQSSLTQVTSENLDSIQASTSQVDSAQIDILQNSRERGFKSDFGKVSFPSSITSQQLFYSDVSYDNTSLLTSIYSTAQSIWHITTPIDRLLTSTLPIGLKLVTTICDPFG